MESAAAMRDAATMVSATMGGLRAGGVSGIAARMGCGMRGRGARRRVVGRGAGGEMAGNGPCGDACGNRTGMAAASTGAIGRVVGGIAHRARLFGGNARAGLARRCEFAAGGGGPHSACAAVIAGPACSTPGEERVVVDRVDVHAAEIGHGLVVIERAPAPIAAIIAMAAIAVSVIDATVKAHRRAPIAGVEGIDAAHPAPPRRGPQQAHGRWSGPYAGHPVIAATHLVPAPEARRPGIAIGRHRWLHFGLQRGWRADALGDHRLRCRSAGHIGPCGCGRRQDRDGRDRTGCLA